MNTTTDMTVKKNESEEMVRAERMRDRLTFVPNVDIVETDEELLLLADMPGVSPESLDIQYEQGAVTIHGMVNPRQNPENTRYVLQEYGVGDYYRTFRVGEGIDADKIAAAVKDGVLELHLPKAQAIRPRKIAVQPG